MVGKPNRKPIASKTPYLDHGWTPSHSAHSSVIKQVLSENKSFLWKLFSNVISLDEGLVILKYFFRT